MVPVVSSVQVPSALAPSATEQASQAPPQALLQQKPSTQKVEAHSTSVRHAVPRARVGTQALTRQYWFAGQF
jgi:IS1 family transposase